MTIEVREYDVGIELLVTLTSNNEVFDVSTATSILFRFRKPSGTEVSKTGILKTDGTDGKVRYVSVANDFNEIGTWRYQVYVELADGSKRTSEMSKFKVSDAISLP